MNATTPANRSAFACLLTRNLPPSVLTLTAAGVFFLRVVWYLQLDAFRRVCRADEGPLAGAEARALHSTMDVAARQAAMQKTLTVRGAMRAQVRPYPSILPSPAFL